MHSSHMLSDSLHIFPHLQNITLSAWSFASSITQWHACCAASWKKYDFFVPSSFFTNMDADICLWWGGLGTLWVIVVVSSELWPSSFSSGWPLPSAMPTTELKLAFFSPGALASFPGSTARPNELP